MKKFLIFLILLILFITAAAFLIPAFYGDKLRQRAELELDKRIQADAQFSRVSFSMFRHFPSITITLHEMSIVGRAPFQGDTLAFADKIHVGVNLWRLITKEEVEVKDLEIEKLLLDVMVLKNGQANYSIFGTDSTAQPADTSSGLSVAMDKVEVKNAEIIYDDR